MIVQACLNGARPPGHHPALPLSAEEIARDGGACVAAGAAELHVHPRAPDGAESLSAVDEAVRALRRTCPGTLIGVSTGAWIEGDAGRTRERIAGWREPPDHASVNLSEPDAPAVMALLDRMGVGVEAGLATPADAARLVALPARGRVLRVLIEIEEQDPTAGDALTEEIVRLLGRAGLRRPVLLHGVEATVWHFAKRARERRWSTRVGLEDGDRHRDGTRARDNAELVAEAAGHPFWAGGPS